jgi:chain length determinant protein (polysaccharide antigen chain regulator)
LYFAKEKWTSKAIITPPHSGQLHNYPIVAALVGGDDTNIINYVFGDYISRLSAVADSFEYNKCMTVKKEKDGSYIVSFSSETPEIAQYRLTDMMREVNATTASVYSSNITRALDANVSAIESTLQAQLKTAEDKRKRYMSLLSEALGIAKSSNINRASVNYLKEIPDDMLFLLGAPVLESMIQREADMPLQLTQEYYENKERLEVLNRVKLDEDDKFQTFSFSQTPTLPAVKDAPKKALILILAVLSGVITGSGLVLVRASLREYRCSKKQYS